MKVALGALALAALLLAACGGERTVNSNGPGPIVIISVDTLRADRLRLYGGTVAETPVIDALAKDSMVFDDAWSQVPLTLPSHVSMLTGRLPAATGVRNNLGYRFDAARIPSIPTLLKARGYDTAAMVSAYVLRTQTGLGAAFDTYDDEVEPDERGAMGELQRVGTATVARAISWIDAHRSRPFFLLVHLFEPHAPYAAPEPYRSKYAAAPYDAEIAASDAALGPLIARLKDLGIYDRATIVFMSDHGEGLGDHGESQHGIFLYREAIRVPLIVKLPGNARAGTRVATPVQLLDVAPTLLEVAGLEVDPAVMSGRSLARIAEGEKPVRRIFSETMYPRIHLGWSDLASLVDGRHHYIEAPRPELYDLDRDPGETVNVLSSERRTYAVMKKEMESHDRSLEGPSNISAEDAAKLSALGYLGGAGVPGTAGPLPDPKDGIADLEAFGRATEMTRGDAPAQAIPILEGIVARNPSFADAWTVLGKAYDQAGRTEDAIRAYRKTIEVAPMLAPGTALSLAEVFLRAGRFDEALDHAALALGTHGAAARLVRARALFGRKDLSAAESELAPALEDHRARLDALVLMAQIRGAQRRLEEALAITGEAERERNARGFGPVAMLAFAEGDALARSGRVDEAKIAFGREVRDFPRNREAYARLAALHVLSGHSDEAERVLREMVAANPGTSSEAFAADVWRRLGE